MAGRQASVAGSSQGQKGDNGRRACVLQALLPLHGLIVSISLNGR